MAGEWLKGFPGCCFPGLELRGRHLKGTASVAVSIAAAAVELDGVLWEASTRVDIKRPAQDSTC